MQEMLRKMVASDVFEKTINEANRKKVKEAKNGAVLNNQLNKYKMTRKKLKAMIEAKHNLIKKIRFEIFRTSTARDFAV